MENTTRKIQSSYKLKNTGMIKPWQKFWLVFWMLIFVCSLPFLSGCATQCVKEPVKPVHDITGYA